MLEDAEMPVWESPDDEGDGAPRGSYNFAPGMPTVQDREHFNGLN